MKFGKETRKFTADVLLYRNFKGATELHRRDTEKDLSVKFCDILWLILNLYS